MDKNVNKELKKLVIEITGGIINDSLTFTKIRLQHNPLYKSLKTGGGNFLMALGLLSILGFLSKIYGILENPKILLDKDKCNELKNYQSELAKRSDINKELVKKFIVPIVGSIIEEEAFVRFVKKIQDDQIVYLGLDGSSARKVWKIYRNKLAHLSIPLSPVGVYDVDLSNLSWQEIEHKISKQGTFLVKDGLILCNSDKLVQNAQVLSRWLCSCIDNYEKEKVINAYNWLTLQLE